MSVWYLQGSHYHRPHFVTKINTSLLYHESRSLKRFACKDFLIDVMKQNDSTVVVTSPPSFGTPDQTRTTMTRHTGVRSLNSRDPKSKGFHRLQSNQLRISLKVTIVRHQGTTLKEEPILRWRLFLLTQCYVISFVYTSHRPTIYWNLRDINSVGNSHKTLVRLLTLYLTIKVSECFPICRLISPTDILSCSRNTSSGKERHRKVF